MSDTFDPEIHRYFRDGIQVPSCTRILEWAGIAKVGPEAPREHARIRGSIVHSLIEDYECGPSVDDVEIPEGFTRQEIYGRFEAWRLFRKEVPISKLMLEHWRIGESDYDPDAKRGSQWSGYAFGVTPDIVCEVDGQPCVIECKNTYSPEITHQLQTAAQVIACGPTRFWKLASWLRYALYLKADGTYKLKQHKDPLDFTQFRLILAAHEEIRRLKGEKVWTPSSVPSAVNRDSKTIEV